MAVRVRVRLSSRGGEVVLSAIANSGFESEGPEIIISEQVARELGLYPRLPEGAEVEEYRSVGGRIRAYRLPGAARASAQVEDRTVGPVEVTVVIVPGEEEALLSDRLIDALEIELLRPGEGLWRFRGEGKVRKSELPELHR